jgi:hypothetical protein
VLLLLAMLPACGTEGDPAEAPDAGPEAGADAGDAVSGMPIRRETPPEPPAPGVDCSVPGDFACLDGDVLFCRQGVGATRWLSRGPCPDGAYCAAGYGCAPVPRCDGGAQVACVGQNEFTCDDAGWRWTQTCPDEVPCEHGRGCPNEDEVGLDCAPGRPPRCRAGHVQHCVESGTRNVWAEPAECPDDSTCVDGAGCVRPGGCDDLAAARCLDAATAVYCDEQPDGTLGWSAPQECGQGCVEGRGCAMRICRDTRWIGGCR